MQSWDINLDKKIIKIIERDERAYFYRLWKELKVSRNTLNRHLTAMRKQGIIEKDPIKQIGKKRYIVLRQAAIDERRLGIFRGMVRQATKHSKRDPENDTEIQKDMRLLVLLLLRAATGITMLSPTKTRIGKEHFNVVDLKGVSIEDILGFRNNVDLLCNNRIFAYLQHSENSIKSMMAMLKAELNRIPDLEPLFGLVSSITYENGNSNHNQLTEHTPDPIRIDSRFVLATNSDNVNLCELNRFLVYCDTILIFVISRMEIKWYSGERPQRKEVEWYQDIFGRDISNSFFLNNLRPIRANLYDGRVCKSKKAKRNRDSWIEVFYAELFDEQEKKFKNIENRYPMFYKIVTDVVFPEFLRSDIELKSPNKQASCESQSTICR